MKHWRHRGGVMALIVTILTASAAWANQPNMPPERSWLRQTPQGAARESSGAQLGLGRWSAVALLVGLSGFALWKSAKRRSLLPPIAGSRIQVGSVVKITPKTQLAIVTVNGRSMLLGTTDVTVTRLMWLDENEPHDISSDDADSPSIPGDRIDPNEMFSTAGSRGVAQRARLKTAQAATPAWKSGNAKSGSKFREILSDVIGGNAPDKGRGISPAEALAATTVDRFQVRDERQGPTPVRKHVANTVMVDCEGQAAGLIARLNRTQS